MMQSQETECENEAKKKEEERKTQEVHCEKGIESAWMKEEEWMSREEECKEKALQLKMRATRNQKN